MKERYINHVECGIKGADLLLNFVLKQVFWIQFIFLDPFCGVSDMDPAPDPT